MGVTRTPFLRYKGVAVETALSRIRAGVGVYIIFQNAIHEKIESCLMALGSYCKDRLSRLMLRV